MTTRINCPFNPGDRVVGPYTKRHYTIVRPHPHWRNMYDAYDKYGGNYILNAAQIRLWTPADGAWEGPE